MFPASLSISSPPNRGRRRPRSATVDSLSSRPETRPWADPEAGRFGWCPGLDRPGGRPPQAPARPGTGLGRPVGRPNSKICFFLIKSNKIIDNYLNNASNSTNQISNCSEKQSIHVRTLVMVFLNINVVVYLRIPKMV